MPKQSNKNSLIASLMNKEPVCSFIFKGAFSTFIGMFLATSCDFGKHLFKKFGHEPVCHPPSFVSSDSIGIIYEWKIEIKDKDSGFFTIYPRDDVLIFLESITKSERIVGIDLIRPTFDKKKTRGAMFTYRDGADEMIVQFRSYSKQLIQRKNTKEDGCETLLQSF